jgi:hypothetical protein
VPFDELLEALEARKQKALAMGGPEKLATERDNSYTELILLPRLASTSWS